LEEQSCNDLSYYVGIDIASQTFTAAAGIDPWEPMVRPREFSNEMDSFAKNAGGVGQDKGIKTAERGGCGSNVEYGETRN
jgi:hypothetical protein